jgi:glycosyltransferase involved in cell wall biosynthesis
MLVPLFAGSGMRVKIIEGMALGKTIISTSIGAEGIDCVNGRDIIIADTADAFITAINHCIKDRPFCEQIGANAQKLIHNKYDNKVVTNALISFYSHVLKD